MTPRDLLVGIPYNWQLVSTAPAPGTGPLYTWLTKEHTILASVYEGVAILSISRRDGRKCGPDDEKILVQMRNDDLEWTSANRNLLTGLVPSLKMFAKVTSSRP